MVGLIVNIDVPDLEAGTAFYTAALGVRVARRLEGRVAELSDAGTPVFLIEKAAGSAIGPAGGGVRDYARHWCPVHPDFAVGDLDAALARAVAAGAVQEGRTLDLPYGRQATFADPFGNGFCLIAFNSHGYDAITI